MQAISEPDSPTVRSAELRGWTWAVVAAFGAYFCMYAFRKPFTAGTYEGTTFAGVGYKTVLVTAQVIGYMISKFIGIKVIAEMPPRGRARALLILIGLAEIALLLFAVVPAPYNFICLFLNGLPLGMVFGLVLGFLEGRRATEALMAGLCASFILADGVTKSVGSYLLSQNVSEAWMPFAAGLLFVPPLLLFVWMLTRIAPPDRKDIAQRSQRAPMNRAERWTFFLKYGVGLTMLVLVYLLITILRSMRADFAPEIWRGLGLDKPPEPEVFTRSEIWVMLGVVLINGSCVLIRDNRRAFHAGLAISLGGVVLIGVSLFGLKEGWLEPFPFMVLVGLGLYIPYVAVHTTIFERLIAMTRDRGNIGYLLYLADAFGYLGYVGVMLARNFFSFEGGFVNFFTTIAWVIASASAILLTGCWLAFRGKAIVTSKSAAE